MCRQLDGFCLNGCVRCIRPVLFSVASMHCIRWSCGECKTDAFLLFTRYISVIYLPTHFSLYLFPLPDAIRTKRLSLGALRSNVSAEEQEKEAEKTKKTRVHDMPCVSLYITVCTSMMFTSTPTVTVLLNMTTIWIWHRSCKQHVSLDFLKQALFWMEHFPFKT